MWKSNVDYPSTSNVRIFKRLSITHLFECIDWNYEPPTFYQSFDLHISLAMSISKKKKLPSLNMCNRKINLFMNPLYSYKETKHQQCLEAFRKNYKLTYQKTFTTHIQNFKVSSTKYISSSNFNGTLSRWPDPSWIHGHLIIMHNFSMACTSFIMSIFTSKPFWSISWKI